MKTLLTAILLAFLSIEVPAQNNSLNFDGVKTWVTVPNHPGLSFGSQFSMEAWVNLPNPTPNQKIVGKSPIESGYVLGVADGKIWPEIWNGPDFWHPTLTRFIAGCVPANQWTHLAVTFVAGGNMIAYVNGIEAYRNQVSNNPILATTTDLFIGMAPFGPPAGFRTTGNIDEIALWSTARTQSQIQTDMLGSIPPGISLIAYYNFNQGIAGGDNTGITTLIDVSGNGHHGTLMSFDRNGSISNFVAGFVPHAATPTPTITGLIPDSGEVGSAVAITGTHFSTIPDNNMVQFNGTAAVVVSSTGKQITTTVPAGAASGTIAVQVDCNVSTNAINASFNVTILPPLWQTWWAYTCYGLIFIGLLLMGRKVVIRRERKKFEVELERKRIEALRESEQLKTKFFSNITHEFRTPLTLIQGPAQELLEKATDTESRQLIGLIKTNSDRLLKLINQLLDLARLDAHEMKLSPQDINLASFFTTIISQFTSLADSRSIHFTWHFSESLPTVYTDDEKLETIVTNLISNSLKFTPAGGNVQVNIALVDNVLQLEVIDNGRGIPQKKLEHIFDRFYQVEPTDSSHAEGTGIGLALVKEYVEVMKGIINVESEKGKGTRFKISIPIAVSQVQTHVTEPLPASLTDTSAHDNGQLQDAELPLILLTEDNEDIRSFIKICLGKTFRYSEARHGREGLEKALSEIPDLIISDLMMPEMDGLEFCARIKKDKRTDHIPFIMLTAKAAEENKLEGLHTGADDYLTKPFNKAELLAKVQNLIALRNNLQAHLKNSLLSQATPIQATSAGEHFIVKAKTYVEAHLADEKLSVETLAHEMNLSREQCYRKLMALTSLSPSAFIRKLRLQKAAQLVAANWGPVSQIAYEVGFENLSYFSKAYKEEFGKLPSEIQ